MNLILMCKNTPVYNITTDTILNPNLVPGSIKQQTQTYQAWESSRYSKQSNTYARRLLLRSTGSELHQQSIKLTRALSLSDTYWLKYDHETIDFNDITPYRTTQYQESIGFKGGNLATIFTNGAAGKEWLNATTLKKYTGRKEYLAFQVASALGIETSQVTLDEADNLLVTNFTTEQTYLETAEQMGIVKAHENPSDVFLALYGLPFAKIIILDYLVEHDDRHWGNYGVLKNTDTGEIVKMAPLYDLDWAWSDYSIPLSQGLLAYRVELGQWLAAFQVNTLPIPVDYQQIVAKRLQEVLAFLAC